MLIVVDLSVICNHLSIVCSCPDLPALASVQALRLFAEGGVSGHAGLEAACHRALGACEGLLHPRATPITGVRGAYAGGCWTSILYLNGRALSTCVMQVC